MQFKDISSYSQGETDRSPRVLRAEINGWLVITVHRHIRFPKDQWLLSSPGLFELWSLKSKDLKAAQSEAVAIVRERLQSALAALAQEQQS
jgi:hypothetical protein